ncbi:hypothetical protein BASA83_009754 [Batrachochytrium salamandrivorans]|nr:hypothetical protein BASA83_009754 [Batrachochytrium salamandrivorans]
MEDNGLTDIPPVVTQTTTLIASRTTGRRKLNPWQLDWSRCLLRVVVARAIVVVSFQVAFIANISAFLHDCFGVNMTQGAGMTIVYALVFIAYELYNIYLIQDAVVELNTPQAVGVTMLMVVIGLYSALQLSQTEQLKSCAVLWRDVTAAASTDAALATINVMDQFGNDQLCPSPNIITASATQTVQLTLRGVANTTFPLLLHLDKAHTRLSDRLDQPDSLRTISIACISVISVLNIVQLILATKTYTVQGWEVLRQHGASLRRQSMMIRFKVFGMLYRLKVFFMACNVIQVVGAILISTVFTDEYMQLVRDPQDAANVLRMIPWWFIVFMLEVAIYGLTVRLYYKVTVWGLRMFLWLSLANVCGLISLIITVWNYPMLVLVQFWFTVASSGVVVLDTALFAVGLQALWTDDISYGLQDLIHPQKMRVWPEPRMKQVGINKEQDASLRVCWLGRRCHPRIRLNPRPLPSATLLHTTALTSLLPILPRQLISGCICSCTLNPAASTMSDNRLLTALLTRIADKLPVSSGLSLSFLAADPIFTQNISWIYELAPWKIHDITFGLIGILDALIKSEESALATHNAPLALTASQSQLLVLRLIANCLARSWSLHRRNSTKTKQGSRTLAVPAPFSLGHDKLRYSPGSQSSEILELNRSPHLRSKMAARGIHGNDKTSSLTSSPLSGSSPLVSSSQYPADSLASVDILIDPPRFDEPVAILLLNQALRFFQTPMGNINLDTYSHSSISPNSQFSNIDILSSAKYGYLPARVGISNFYKGISSRMSEDAISQSILSLNGLDAVNLEFELEYTASLIIYYLSASNWGIILARIKTKIASFYHYPSGASSLMSHVSSSKGDAVDINLADLRMLECCHFDIGRLSTALAEITPHLKIFHKKTMAVAVVGIRKAIWNWIEAFPLEFASLCHDRKNLDGHPEVLFDFLHVNADSSRKKNLYWPTQTMLLLLSAEDLFLYTNAGSSGASLAKKIQFLESLKKTIKNNKGYDSAVLCYTDLCKAATFASKSDGASLRILIGSFETELKEKLFDPLRPISLSTEDSGTIDESLLSDCLTSLFKLNPLNTLRNVYPVLVEPGVPPLYRMLFMKSCADLVTDTAPLPWNPPIDVALADYIRHLFLEYVGRDKHSDVKARRQFLKIQRDRRTRKLQAEEAERSEMILGALQCWSSSPTLAIVRDSTVITSDEFMVLSQAIAACLLDPMEAIRSVAAQTLLRLFDPQFIGHWDGARPDWRQNVDTFAPSETGMRVFWRTSSAVLHSVARQLLDIHSQPEVDVDIVQDTVSLLCDLLFSRNQFLRIRSEFIAASTGCAIQERFAASAHGLIIQQRRHLFLEVAVSTINNINATTTTTANATTNDDNNNNNNTTTTGSGGSGSNAASAPPTVGTMPVFPIVQNLDMYRSLSKMFDDTLSAENVLVMSNKAQQKALRKALQRTERPTPGNLGAWEEVYRRWRIISQGLLKGTMVNSMPAGGGGGGSGAGNGSAGVTAMAGVVDKLTSSIGKLDVDDDDQAKSSRFARHKVSLRSGTDYVLPAATSSISSGQMMGRASSDIAFGSGDDQAEWHNYTGFLCSLGNVCLLASQHLAAPSSTASASGVASGASLALGASMSLQPASAAGLLSIPSMANSINGGVAHSGGLERAPTVNKASLLSPQTLRVSNILGSVDKHRLNVTSSADDISSSSGHSFLDPLSPLSEGVTSINWGASVNSQLAISYSRAKQTVERFVRELVELMIHTGPVVRDAIRELLATEASGGLYAILFMFFERSLVGIFSPGTDDICSERNIMLVETILIITRSVLDRASDLYANSKSSSEPFAQSSAVHLSLYSIDFAWIILNLSRFINRLAMLPAHAIAATRAKIRVCQLLEQLLHRKELVGIKQDVLFRNRMMQVVLEWNSEFSIKTGDQQQVALLTDGTLKINAELDGMTMLAIVALLDGLPLVPVNESNGTLTEIDDDDNNKTKTKMFSTNLTFFLKVLQTCKIVETIDANRQQITPELRALINKSKESTQHLTLLKDNTIIALSNLISANIKAGLKYSLSIAYHEDPRTRAAFMHVLANILEGGSVSGLLNGKWKDSKFTRLLELLTDDDLAIVLTLCDVTSSNDIDSIATALLGIFEKFGKASKLISTVIEDEIQHTDTATGIFRRNSIATKLLTMYARSESQDFLYITLRPIIFTLSEMNPGLSFEIDPLRLETGGDLTVNMANLQSVTQDFLTNIFGNVAHFPTKLRLICAKVAESVSRKFPGAGLLGVGAFVFLRFICPAIVAPETHNLIRAPIQQRELRRGLILITKVVQNLANCVLFGAKEGFMLGLNVLLEANQDAVQTFLSEISTSVSSERSIDDPAISVHTEELTGFATMLHGQLENYFGKMERAVAASTIEGHSGPNVAKYGTISRGMLRNLEDSTDLSHLGEDEQLGSDFPISPAVAQFPIIPPANTPLSLAAKKKAALDQLSIILAQLGPASFSADVSGSRAGMYPSPAPLFEVTHAESTSSGNSTHTNSSWALHDFMKRQAGLPTKPGMLKFIKEQRVFYEAGTSTDGRPVLYYITRKVQPDSVDMNMLLHVILEQCAALVSKPFDLLVDLTFVGREHQWPTEALHTLEKVLPNEARQNLHTLFFLHANTYFKVMAKHAPRLLHSRMAKRTVFCSNVKDLFEFISKDKLILPKSTLGIYDQDLTVFTQTQVHLFKGSSMGVTLSISQNVLILLMTKKQELMGLQPPIVDIFHISDIRDVGVSSNDPKNGENEFYIKFHEKHGASTPMIPGGSTTIYLSSQRRDNIIQALRSAVARFQLSRPPISADERNVSPRDLPGTLLNIALLNLCSEEPTLRVSSYDLLCAIVTGFGFNAGTHLHRTKGLAIPLNSHRFVQDISITLAKSEVSLTFEFVAEGLLGYPRLSRELQLHMLNYLSPWLPNLVVYLLPADSIENASQVAESRAKVTQVLTTLIHLTLKERENFLAIQTHVWSVIGQHEVLLPITINLFIETAKNLPFAANETEILANTLITLASPNSHAVSGVIIRALRHALSSTYVKPRTSVVDHSAWGLVQILLRFTLMLSFDDKLCLSIYIADLFHALTLVVGLGSPILRRTVHGIVLNTLQVLLATSGLGETNISGLHIALDKLHDPKYARMFAISSPIAASSSSTTSSASMVSSYRNRPEHSRHYITSAFVVNSETVQGEVVRELQLPEIDFFVNTLIEIVTYGAPTIDICATWKTRWISLAARSAFEDNFTAQIRSFLMIGSLAKEGFDSDLLYQTLVALRSALLRFEDNKPLLVQSVVKCLCNSLYSAPAHEHIIVPLFWLALGLVQVGYIPFFHSGLDLLHVVLRLIEENPALRGTVLTRALLNGRLAIQNDAIKLDHETLIYFGEFLSFSVAATLLKGLSNPILKLRTTNVLTMLLRMSAYNADARLVKSGSFNPGSSAGSIDADLFVRDSLGYVIALLPTTENPETLLTLAGLARRGMTIDDDSGSTDASEGSDELLNRLNKPTSRPSLLSRGLSVYGASTWRERLLEVVPLSNQTTAALIFGMLQALLEASEFEPEVLQIYRLLAAIADHSPIAFYPLYVRLISRFSNIMLTTKSPQLSDLVHAIFLSMAALTVGGVSGGGGQMLSSSSASPRMLASASKVPSYEDISDVLTRNGFSGMLTALSPDQQLSKDTKMRRITALCEIIDVIVHSAAF